MILGVKPRARRCGFTLIETLVALAVLMAGASALALYRGAFLRITSMEMQRSGTALEASRYMESLLALPPACADTSFELPVGDLSRSRLSVTTNVVLDIPALVVLAGRAFRNPQQTSGPRYTSSPQQTPPAFALEWVEVRSPNHTFRRLIRCRKVSR